MQVFKDVGWNRIIFSLLLVGVLLLTVGETSLRHSAVVATMDKDFVERLQKISLTEEEETDIAVRVNHRRETLEECSLSMIGRFLCEKTLNLRAAKSLLRSVWRMGSDLRIVEVGTGLLQFKFLLESQMKWVEDNGPWSFDNHLLVLRGGKKGCPHSMSPSLVYVYGFRCGVCLSTL